MLKHCKAKLLDYWKLGSVYVVLKEHLHFDFKPSDFPWWLRSIFSEVISIEGDEVMDETFYITLPTGFVCDLASIPKWLQWLFKPDGPWAKAAAVHDFLYNIQTPKARLDDYYQDIAPKYLFMEEKLSNRSCCDAIFYVAMRQSGVNPAIALAFYLGVRAGGSKHFRTGKKIPVGELLTEFEPVNSYGYTHAKDPYPIFTSSPYHAKAVINANTVYNLVMYPNLPTPVIN